MSKKKNPNKHKTDGIPIRTKMALEARFRKENTDARQAGKEYGILAMGTIAIMATIAHENDSTKIRDYIIQSSEILSADHHIELKELIELVNAKMESSVTTDQIVEADPTMAQFF